MQDSCRMLDLTATSRDTYSGGDFVILTPVFLTLRQQTLQRLLDAGLRNSDGSDPVVLPYAFSAQTTVIYLSASCFALYGSLTTSTTCEFLCLILGVHNSLATS